MNLKPTKKNVLVKPIHTSETTASGIYLAPVNRDPSITGTVLAVGPDVTLLSVGDRVLVSKVSPSAGVMIEDDKCYMLKEDDILAVIE